MHDHPVVAAFDLLVLFVVANHHAAVPEVVGEGVRHLLIEEGQQAVAGVDQVNFDVHSAEDRRIFATNDPCAIDNDVAGFMVQAQNRVAVVDARVREVHVGRMVRA